MAADVYAYAADAPVPPGSLPRDVSAFTGRALMVLANAGIDRLEANERQFRTVLHASYGQLDDADRRLFRLLGLHRGTDFDAAAAAGLADVDLSTATAALGRLVYAHLVTEGAPGRFALHDLLHLFARQTCDETDDQAARDAAQTRLVAHYAELARNLEASLDLATFEAELPNLLAAMQLASRNGWHEKVWQLGWRSTGRSVT
jgi:hypothetical protein